MKLGRGSDFTGRVNNALVGGESGLLFSAAEDVNLYKHTASGALKTDDDMRVGSNDLILRANGTLEFGGANGNGIIEMAEQGVAPGNAPADRGRLFIRDNGAGKTQLCVRFPTGAALVIATEV